MTVQSHAGEAEHSTHATPAPLDDQKPMTSTVQSARNSGIAGFVAGASTTLLLHPLDLIKTRLQVSTSPLGKGLFPTKGSATPGCTSSTHSPPPPLPAALSGRRVLLDVWRDHGLRGLYRGVTPNFIASTLSWGLYFWWFSWIKDMMRATQPPSTISSQPSPSASQSNGRTLSALDYLFASAAAGTLTSAFTNPLWVMKTQMCAQNATDPAAIPSMSQGLRDLWRREGIRGLYRGYLPALLGTSHGAIQFMVYEELKSRFPPSSEATATLEYTGMAVVSKIVAAIVTYPYQVVRARLQVTSLKHNVSPHLGDRSIAPPPTIRQVLRSTWKSQGIRGFYRGLTVNVARVLPGTVVTFGTYESVKRALDTLHTF